VKARLVTCSFSQLILLILPQGPHRCGLTSPLQDLN